MNETTETMTMTTTETSLKPIPEESLTRQQSLVVEWVRARLIAAVVGEAHAAGQEIKRFEVKGCEGTKHVLVSIDFGRIGDEGTMAAILCRYYFAWMIGPRGGCRRIDSKVSWEGHPSTTHFKPKDDKQAALIRKFRRESKAS